MEESLHPGGWLTASQKTDDGKGCDKSSEQLWQASNTAVLSLLLSLQSMLRCPFPVVQHLPMTSLVGASYCRWWAGGVAISGSHP